MPLPSNATEQVVDGSPVATGQRTTKPGLTYKHSGVNIEPTPIRVSPEPRPRDHAAPDQGATLLSHDNRTRSADRMHSDPGLLCDLGHLGVRLESRAGMVTTLHRIRCWLCWHSPYRDCAETIDTNEAGHVVVIQRTYRCQWCKVDL